MGAESRPGDGGLILKQETTVTPVQIRDWHNTPIDIVDNPGPGLIAELVGVVTVALDWGTVVHVDGGDLAARYNGASDRILIFEANGLINAAADTIRQAGVGRNPGQPQNIQTFANASIEMLNNGAAFTGAGDSPAIVTAHYLVVASPLP